jgi:hypothetical protein
MADAAAATSQAPFRLNLTQHICHVEPTARVLAGLLAHHLHGLNKRHRVASEKGDQLSDRCNAKDLDPLNQLRLPGLPQRDDHPRETCLLSRQSRRQNATYRTEATVQTDFAQQSCTA